MVPLVFRAFEHAAYNIRNEGREGKILPQELYESLVAFAGDKELPYYSLTAAGVRFSNYVGALQIGKWTVEVLPKIDRKMDEALAQDILIQMLRQAGIVNLNTPSESDLRIKRNYILDSYIRLFLDEVKMILHRGLIKHYHKNESNSAALKGSLIFSRHISKNLTHAERFYVRHTIYDQQHLLNLILFKTLLAISDFTSGTRFQLDIKNLKLLFPQLDDINISEVLFTNLKWNRKNDHYRKAIEISRLLLLNYHPDLSHGHNHVLALMFDMNDLWEKWVARRLKVVAINLNIPVEISLQSSKIFWVNEFQQTVRQRPDIILDFASGKKVVLDTKWKLVSDKPSEDDLRQMFAYNKLFGAKHSYLLYPGTERTISGRFFDFEDEESCGLAFVPFLSEGNLSSLGVENFLVRIQII